MFNDASEKMQYQQQLQSAQSSQLKQADLYDQLRQAVSDWQKACKEAAFAQERRAQMKDQLDKISSLFAEHISQAVQDPTIPQTQPPVNGAFIGNAAQQIRY